MNTQINYLESNIRKYLNDVVHNFNAQAYQFDQKNLSYVPLKKKSIFSNEIFWQLFSIIIVLLMGVAMTGVNFYKRTIALENQESYNIASSLSHKVTLLESQIEKIHQNERSLYSSVLGIEPTDDGVWEGGTGGNGKRISSGNKILDESISKVEKLNYKLTVQNTAFRKLKLIAVNRKEELTGLPVLRPLNGPVVSGFCYRGDPYTGHVHFHQGLDMVSHYGAPIFASGDGQVTVSGWKESGYGIQIMLKHPHGYQTKYAHLSNSNVSEGQKVKRGQVIGYVGSTGYSTGPHLHYEIIKDGKVINPSEYLLLQ